MRYYVAYVHVVTEWQTSVTKKPQTWLYYYPVGSRTIQRKQLQHHIWDDDTEYSNNNCIQYLLLIQVQFKMVSMPSKKSTCAPPISQKIAYSSFRNRSNFGLIDDGALSSFHVVELFLLLTLSPACHRWCGVLGFVVAEIQPQAPQHFGSSES